MVSGSLDTSIRVWHVETGNCIHTLTGHQSLTSGMELKDNILVSGNADSTVKIWDIKTGQCLQTLQGKSWPSVSLSLKTSLLFKREPVENRGLTLCRVLTPDEFVNVWLSKVSHLEKWFSIVSLM